MKKAGPIYKSDAAFCFRVNAESICRVQPPYGKLHTIFAGKVLRLNAAKIGAGKREKKIYNVSRLYILAIPAELRYNIYIIWYKQS